jgi:hypothetical protein
VSPRCKAQGFLSRKYQDGQGQYNLQTVTSTCPKNNWGALSTQARGRNRRAWIDVPGNWQLAPGIMIWNPQHPPELCRACVMHSCKQEKRRAAHTHARSQRSSGLLPPRVPPDRTQSQAQTRAKPDFSQKKDRQVKRRDFRFGCARNVWGTPYTETKLLKV